MITYKEERAIKKLVVLCAACGVGKSTVKNYLNRNSTLKNFVFYDTDEIGLNWHNYKNKPDGGLQYFTDCLKIISKKAGNKNILYACCMNPLDYRKIPPVEDIAETYFINLICSDEQLYQRLKGRPKERMTDSDEFISSQVDYMNWFRTNTQLMDYIIDNTKLTVNETAGLIENFLRSLCNLNDNAE